jgi:cob(I)alamin adenosyltransferase
MEHSKLYTKTGDKGISSLYNSIRLTKSSIYFKLLGDLDELNCHIGMAKSLWKEYLDKSEIKVYQDDLMNYTNKPSIDTNNYYELHNLSVLTEVQCIIMDISSFVATPPWHEAKPIKGNIEECIENWVNKVGFNNKNINKIEKYIDLLDSVVPPIKNFVVPGNNTLVSSIHICRAVTRRCERVYLEFLQTDLLCYNVYEHVDYHFNIILVYLNRLSDMFFALSRFLAHNLNITEECYSKSKGLLNV